MGQKVNPIVFRLGNQYTWNSRWFASDKKRYRHLVIEDVKIRRALMEKLKNAGISRVEIGRSINRIDIIVHVAKPGVVIGRGGTGLEDLKKFLLKYLNITEKDKSGQRLDLRVEPVSEPGMDAYIVATNIAAQIAKRMPTRRIANQTIEKVMAAGAKGVRILFAGRINGAEIARKEKYQEGSIPLHTIRANIDFASVPSLTRSGYVGVKVWIHK